MLKDYLNIIVFTLKKTLKTVNKNSILLIAQKQKFAKIYNVS